MVHNSVINIEIVYPTPEHLFRKIISLPEDSTVQDALVYVADWPVLDWETQSMGIFSKKVSLNTVLQKGDRLEIYRPLEISPMDKRRKLALKPK